jgi:hypothetical protein
MRQLPLAMPDQVNAMHNNPSSSWLRRNAPNMLRFQLGWFASVLGAAQGLAWLGPVVIAVILFFHLRAARHAGQEALLLSLTLFIGLLFETPPALLGWVGYTGHTAILPPLWMIALWVCFATTLNVSLRGLREHTALLALFGLIGGPVAYWGGVNLGAMHWLQAMPELIYLALGWAVLTPLLGRLALRLDGYRHEL